MKFSTATQTSYSVISGLMLLLTVCGCGSSDTKTESKQAEGKATTVEARPAATGKKGIVLFYGNSLTAGYGVEPSQAFPALVGQKIDSAGLNYQVVNAGLSGETTAGGKSRIS